LAEDFESRGELYGQVRDSFELDPDALLLAGKVREQQPDCDQRCRTPLHRRLRASQAADANGSDNCR